MTMGQDRNERRQRTPNVNDARGWTRRAILSALAGGGMTAVGLGGPLSGGALAADAPTGLAPPSESSTTPAPSQEAPQTTTSETTTTATGTTPTATTPAGGPSTVSTPSTTPTSTSEATKPPAPGPRVLIQRPQKPTLETEGPTPSTAATTPTPPTTPPTGSGNIAPAPQIAAGQSGTLAALIAGSAVSTRALGFYRIPLFLLPIYQAAAVQYGVPWQILAAINEVETNFGTDQSVSTAGAVGWMQFMPETWLQYGVDALGAGYADPYNPVDAIFAAARYLHAAGAATDLHAAILAYNHSEAYVQSVLLRARLFASYPASVIATLTGLTEGKLPVLGAKLSPNSSIPQGVAPSPLGVSSATAGASAVTPSKQKGAVTPGSTPPPSPAVSAARAERALNAAAPPSQLSELLGLRNAPVVAVEDGRIVGLGVSRKLGRYLVLRDTYGDLFTYAGLGSIAPGYRLPKPAQVRAPKGALQSRETASDPTPKQPASAGRQIPLTLHVAKKAPTASKSRQVTVPSSGASQGEASAGVGKVRVFAHPGNPDAIAAAHAAERTARLKARLAGWMTLGRGSVVAQGTVLGHLASRGEASHATLRFAIRPAGAQSAIDPRPIFENWKQLDAALHPQGAKDGPVLAGATASDAFLLSQPELERAVLADPGIKLARCDRTQVAAGKVSREALAVLVFLSRSGLKPNVVGLRCGRSAYTARGPVISHHTTGAIDITAVNGVPIAHHQGSGTITDITIRTLLTLQPQFAAKQIVSLMKYPGAPSTVAQADHSTYIQVELPRKQQTTTAVKSARAGAAHTAGASKGSSVSFVAAPALSTSEWQRLLEQVGGLQVAKVARKPSSAAIRDKQAAPGNQGLGTRTLP
jgi:Transglycosylase SLT domain